MALVLLTKSTHSFKPINEKSRFERIGFFYLFFTVNKIKNISSSNSYNILKILYHAESHASVAKRLNFSENKALQVLTIFNKFVFIQQIHYHCIV